MECASNDRRGREHAGRAGATTLVVASALAACVVAAGCGAPRATGPQAPTAMPAHAGAGGERQGALTSRDDRVRLAALTAERNKGPADAGYRIGPDDLLDIRIPDFLDAQPLAQAAAAGEGGATRPMVAGSPTFQQGMRVSGRGDITLPMIGIVKVDGRTPSEVERAIAAKLKSAGILRSPQVSVQVAEYRSRAVAVIGAVERPGLYPITRPGATIADLIWAAGGPSKDAGRLVEFAPTKGGDDAARAALALRNASSTSLSSARGVAWTGVEQASATSPAAGPPMRLDLDLLTHAVGTDARDLNPPVRAGDVISLPAAGSVLVDGWVDKPGSYQVTRGLTVSGAIAAAGGSKFPADRRGIQVKRVMGGGEEQTFTVDLDAVATGQAADVPITDGDVVRVPADNARLVPYGAWSIVKEMVHIGGNVLLF